MRRRALVGAVLLTAALGGCISVPDPDDPDTASMTVTPAVALYDEPVTVTMAGLGAGRETTVTARTTDGAGVTWTSSADFRARPDGTLDLGGPPRGGSYLGANPMGLFQRMAPEGQTRGFFAPEREWVVTLEARVEGRTVATATATRRTPTGAGVTATPLRVPRDGLHGTLFSPPDTGTRRAAVLVIGGSGGGLSYLTEAKAALLAAHGHPALALAYFGEPGLPPTLTGIPLEYFRTALRTLRDRPGADPARLFVQGTSFGGEAALLLAATYPDLVGGVVAEVPSSYVDGAPGNAARSAWSLGGRDLPHGRAGVRAADVDRSAWIPVERIRGRVVLACGALDTVWPSCGHVDDVVARLADPVARSATVLRFPTAGHYVGGPPNLPLTDEGLTTTGGEVAGTQVASVALHRAVLEALR